MNQYGIYHNLRVKSFPDGTSECMVADRAIFREPGWELRGKRTSVSRETAAPEAVEQSVYALERAEAMEAAKARENLSRAKRRARNQLRDYALCTPMRYFLTLTFAPEKIDRYDVRATVRRFGQWMSNQVKRRGISYVAVAEYHKDGAIHFHALVTDGLQMADSGTMVPPDGGRPRRPRNEAQRALWARQGGRTVYNVSGWPYGFSTAMELYGDYHAAVGYVCKYITKAPGKIGGRWFYSGGELGRPDVLLADVDCGQVRSQHKVKEVACPSLKNTRIFLFVVPGAGTSAGDGVAVGASGNGPAISDSGTSSDPQLGPPRR